MEQKVIRKGGSFLFEEVPPAEVFTPEDFGEEHEMIVRTTKRFIENEVLPNAEALEHKDWDLTRKLMIQAGELGILGVDIEEEYGGAHLDSIASPLQDLRQLFDHMDRTSVEGWQRVLARLRGLPAAAEGYRSRLEDGRRRGYLVARRQVLEGIRQASAHGGEDSSLYDLSRELEGLEIGDAALHASII